MKFTKRQLTDEEIERRLTELERKYEMSSKQFLIDFNSGRLGDEADFIDWSGLLMVAAKVGIHHGTLA